MTQETGWIGRAIGRMISNTVRTRFRNVYWQVVSPVPPGPIVFAATHHGWHDGYIMFHVVKALDRPALDWITEFEAFPLFRYAGGMPFPRDNDQKRAATIRSTIRQMREDGRSLILFPEVHLHRGPEILPLGKAVELLLRKVPQACVVPVAILYDMSLHERPEAFVRIGARMSESEKSAAEIHAAMVRNLEELKRSVPDQDSFEVLVRGTPDVNERWDFRARFGKKT